MAAGAENFLTFLGPQHPKKAPLFYIDAPPPIAWALKTHGRSLAFSYVQARLAHSAQAQRPDTALTHALFPCSDSLPKTSQGYFTSELGTGGDKNRRD